MAEVVRFGRGREFGVLLEVNFEVISRPVFRTFGHRVFSIKDIEVVMVLFWYGFPELCIPLSGRGEVLLGGMT